MQMSGRGRPRKVGDLVDVLDGQGWWMTTVNPCQAALCANSISASLTPLACRQMPSCKAHWRMLASAEVHAAQVASRERGTLTTPVTEARAVPLAESRATCRWDGFEWSLGAPCGCLQAVCCRVYMQPTNLTSGGALHRHASCLRTASAAARECTKP